MLQFIIFAAGSLPVLQDLLSSTWTSCFVYLVFCSHLFDPLQLVVQRLFGDLHLDDLLPQRLVLVLRSAALVLGALQLVVQTHRHVLGHLGSVRNKQFSEETNAPAAVPNCEFLLKKNNIKFFQNYEMKTERSASLNTCLQVLLQTAQQLPVHVARLSHPQALLLGLPQAVLQDAAVLVGPVQLPPQLLQLVDLLLQVVVSHLLHLGPQLLHFILGFKCDIKQLLRRSGFNFFYCFEDLTVCCQGATDVWCVVTMVTTTGSSFHVSFGFLYSLNVKIWLFCFVIYYKLEVAILRDKKMTKRCKNKNLNVLNLLVLFSLEFKVYISK